MGFAAGGPTDVIARVLAKDMTATLGQAVVVAAYDAPLRTIPDLLKQARSKPDAVSFASSGSGGSGHLAAELLATSAKAKMLHVPYKGNGPALLARVMQA